MARVVATLALLLIPACAGRGAPTSFPDARSSADELDPRSLRIQVDNQDFQDATIFAADGSSRRRLGRVAGKTKETFTFRWDPPQLTMVADFTGARSRRSDRLAVSQGLDDDLLLIIRSGRTMWIGRKGGD